MNEGIPHQPTPEGLPLEQQPIIDGVPGMEPVESPEPSRDVVTLENPTPQTLRTAIGTPYAEVAPGVLAPSETEDKAPVTEVNSSLGTVAVENIQADDDRPDASKAWDMAYGGKDERDSAARQRKRANNIEIGLTELPDTVAKLREPSEQRLVLDKALTESEKSGNRDTPEWEDLLERDKALREDIKEIIRGQNVTIQNELKQLTEAVRKGRDYDEVIDAKKESLSINQWKANNSAEKSDASAERLEEWAGILHDHPLSEAYKERFGLENVTPATLVKIEDEIATKQSLLDEAKEEISLDSAEEIQVPYINNPVVNSYARKLAGMGFAEDDSELQSPNIAEFAYTPGSQEYVEYKSVMGDRQASSEDRERMYKAALQQYTKNVTLDIKLKKTFLEDIKTGRANMWQ